MLQPGTLITFKEDIVDDETGGLFAIKDSRGQIVEPTSDGIMVAEVFSSGIYITVQPDQVEAKHV